MGFIEKNIMDGENIIYRAKLHWIILWPIVFFVLFIFSILKAVFSGQFKGFAHSPTATGTSVIQVYAQFLPLFIILSIIIIPGVISLINYITSEFGVTNKRVLAKFGFIRRRSTEIILTKVEGIIVDQSILGRLLNYGSVIISGTGGLKNSFKKISKPLEFRQKVQNQISNPKE